MSAPFEMISRFRTSPISTTSMITFFFARIGIVVAIIILVLHGLHHTINPPFFTRDAQFAFAESVIAFATFVARIIFIFGGLSKVHLADLLIIIVFFVVVVVV